MTRRILITIEYDGASFVGWQRQDNGDSVQAAIEAAAEAFTGTPTPVAGAGRTDSGVHATSQVAHLDVPDRFDAKKVMYAHTSSRFDTPALIEILATLGTIEKTDFRKCRRLELRAKILRTPS